MRAFINVVIIFEKQKLIMDKYLFEYKPINFRVLRFYGQLFQFLFPADSGDQSGKLSARGQDGSVPVRVSDFRYTFCEIIWNGYHYEFIIAKTKD